MSASDKVKEKINIAARHFNPSPGKILLPSTVGIPPRNARSTSRLRDPRILWAPAISISGKNDQPFMTPQYQKKEQRLVEKSERTKLNPKIMTTADLSHVTRSGNDRTKLPMSFLPHKISPPTRPLSHRHRSNIVSGHFRKSKRHLTAYRSWSS